MTLEEINKNRDEHAESTYELNGVYYVLIHDKPKSWENAKSYSRSLGACLATIPDEATNAFLAERLLERKINAAWIGLNDIANEGEFVWDSGKPVTYSNWLAREPNNNANSPSTKAGEDHVLLHSNYGWSDYNGYETSHHFLPFFVEYTR